MFRNREHDGFSHDFFRGISLLTMNRGTVKPSGKKSHQLDFLMLKTGNGPEQEGEQILNVLHFTVQKLTVGTPI